MSYSKDRQLAGLTQRQRAGRSARELAAAKKILIQRELGLCAVCSEIGRDPHHRQNRGMGGAQKDLTAHRFSRLCYLCRPCHDRVDQEIEGWAKPLGLYVPHGVTTCAEVPLLYRGQWVLLDDDANVIPTSAPAA